MARRQVQNLTRDAMIREAVECIRGKTPTDEAIARMEAKGFRLIDPQEAKRREMRALLGEGRRRLDKHGEFASSPVHLFEVIEDDKGRARREDYWKKRLELTLDEACNELIQVHARVEAARVIFRRIANYHRGVFGTGPLQLNLPFGLPD